MTVRARCSVGSLLLVSLSLPSLASAQAGREGMRTIAASNVVLNTYTTLSMSAAAGATTVRLASAADLASMSFSSLSLSSGDLLLVYQAQGATIDATNTAQYGTVTDLGSSGRWQFVRVGSVAGDEVTLSASEHPTGLSRAFSAGAQVVRVPQFTRLLVAASGSVSAPAWDGTRGGIVALVSNSDLTVVGSVSANARGFRGGVADNMSLAPGNMVTNFRSVEAADGAEKGESIAGGSAQYNALSGRYGRGAPANGGGGGNAHNAGGGGGANGGATTGYNGAGVMSASVVGASAWALDPAFMLNGNALTNGPGGGRGGYSYSANNVDALVVAPNQATWGGDSRSEFGGRGGRALGASLDRLFLGGGGGAGDANNNVGGSGGSGGGLVFLVARTIDGNGTISANGADGASVFSPGNDAPGGAGAGGTIVLSSIMPVTSALTVSARGGDGGSQSIASSEAEGPGGGGGGGVVHIPAASTIVPVVVGGVSGTTTSTALTEFPSNGATAGAGGSIVNTLATCAMFTGICPLDTSTFVTLSSPMTGGFIATRTPTITGTAEPGATVVVSVGGTTAMTMANAMGAWSVTLGAAVITADGAITITVTATDAAMNTASASAMVTVDTVVPTVVIAAPAAMALLNTGAPTITGTAEAGSTVALDFGGGRTASVTADAMGNWSYAVPMGMRLADGPVTVSAVATDRAGNSSAPRTVMFTVDTVTSVAITSPMTGSTVGNRTPVLRGTAEDGATITVTVNGMMLTTTADAMGNWSVSVPAGAITMDGMVTFAVSSVDRAGNTATATSTVTVDSRVVVTITAPTTGSTVNSRTPTITGTARPNATVTLDFGGGRTAMVTADAMGNWSYMVPAGMELMDGAMVMLSARSMGPSGEVTVSVNFTVDASTTVAVTSPVRESRVDTQRPEIRGTGEPGATITLVFDTGERATVTVDAMGNWSFTPAMPLRPGENSVQITAQDRAGNMAMQRHVFVVVVVSSPDAGGDASGDASSDASADVMGDVSGDVVGDVRADASSASDAMVPTGTLEGTGACNCAVIGLSKGTSTDRAAWALILACAVTTARASRRRSPSKQSHTRA